MPPQSMIVKSFEPAFDRAVPGFFVGSDKFVRREQKQKFFQRMRNQFEAQLLAYWKSLGPERGLPLSDGAARDVTWAGWYQGIAAIPPYLSAREGWSLARIQREWKKRTGCTYSPQAISKGIDRGLCIIGETRRLSKAGPRKKLNLQATTRG